MLQTSQLCIKQVEIKLDRNIHDTKNKGRQNADLLYKKKVFLLSTNQNQSFSVKPE